MTQVLLVLSQVLLVVSIVGSFFTVMMLLRNDQIAVYRMHMIDQVSLCAKRDMLLNRNWQWRYEIYEAVSYQKMMRQFWKRLDSFYPDKRFLNPEAKQ